MRVLVTGATGFVGTSLIPLLEQHGHGLTLALRTSESEDRLPGQSAQSVRRTVVVGEIDAHTDWRDALQGADAVIHLAARAHVFDETADEEEAFVRINSSGTDRLVQQSIEANVERFVLMSSIGAVTQTSEVRVTLDTPCAPSTPYGRSKLAAERALIERAADSEMGWTILRPTLVYGPGNPGNMQRLIALVKRGWPLPLSSIRNRRSFTFVGNLADATVTALSHPSARDTVFLVADGEDVSTLELIHKIAALTGTRTRLFDVPVPVLLGLAWGADRIASASGISLPFGARTVRRLVSSLCVDIEALRAKLDWTPPYSLDEGLRCMLTPP
ncbi:MAG: NAD-dependent epimerase/dehydratase family protein [Polyangiales bacterium]